MIAKKVVTLFSFLAVSLISSAQEQMPLTVFSYSLHLGSGFRAKLGDADEVMENVRSYFRGIDPLKEGIIDETYDKLVAHIEESTKFKVLPVDTLRYTDGKLIFYTPRGYPMGSKRRAITHQTSQYYGLIQIDVAGRTRGSYSKLGPFQWEKTTIKPRVCITMKVFDEKGNRVGRYVVRAKTEGVIVIQTRVSGWVKADDDRRLKDGANLQILTNLIDEAIDMLINEDVDKPN